MSFGHLVLKTVISNAGRKFKFELAPFLLNIKGLFASPWTEGILKNNKNSFVMPIDLISKLKSVLANFVVTVALTLVFSLSVLADTVNIKIIAVTDLHATIFPWSFTEDKSPQR